MSIEQETEQMTLETGVVTLPQLSIPERLEAVRDATDGGFYPTSREELQRALTLLDYVGRPMGAAHHLAEIQQHQNKAQTDDPESAVRSVVNVFGGLALKARYDGHYLRELQTALGDLHSVSVLSSVAKVQDSLPDGLGQLVREHDLHLLSRNECRDFDPLGRPRLPWMQGKPPAGYDRYTVARPDEATAARIGKVLIGVRIYEARDVTQLALERQRKRYGFWIDRLVEAEELPSAAADARSFLRSLKIAKK